MKQSKAIAVRRVQETLDWLGEGTLSLPPERKRIKNIEGEEFA